MKNLLNRKDYLSTLEHESDTRNRIDKRKWKNDGFRSLLESSNNSEVNIALNDWKENTDIDKYVLVGGLAYGFYARPRPTDDIDLVFLTSKDFPEEVYKFRKLRPHAFIHLKYHVEVELLDPKHINNDISFHQAIFDTSILSDGIRVASPVGLIAMKLGRFSGLDRVDIIELYEYCKMHKIEIDLSIFNLDKEKLEKYEKLIEEISEKVHNNMYMLERCGMFRDNVLHEKIETPFSFDIYIFEDTVGEPRFNVGRNIPKSEKTIHDFMFAISLTETYKNGKLKVVDSSTWYPSFLGFEKEEKELNEWLTTNNNLKLLKDKWKQINKRSF